MQKVLLLSCVVGLCLLISSTMADMPDVELHTKCLYPVVKILLSDGGGGSGVIVRSFKVKEGEYTNIVITAGHILTQDIEVLVPKYENWSVLKEYVKYPCGIVTASNKYDLGIVAFYSKEPMYTANIDFTAKYYIGSKIIKMGYGVLDEARLDSGEITSVKFASKDLFKDCIRMNNPTTLGDSGGPCYLQSSNKLIAINRGMRTYNGQGLPHHAFATPITFLQEWNKEQGNTLNYTFDTNIPVNIDIKAANNNYMVLLLTNQINDINKNIESLIMKRNLIIEKMGQIVNNVEPIIPEVDPGEPTDGVPPPPTE